MASTAKSLAARLRTSLDLFEAGTEMHLMTLRRSNPGASNEELRDLLRDWLHSRWREEFTATHISLREESA